MADQVFRQGNTVNLKNTIEDFDLEDDFKPESDLVYSAKSG